MPIANTKGNTPKAQWTAILVDPFHESLRVLEDALSSQGQVHVLAKTSSYSLIPALAGKHKPDFIFLSLDPSNTLDLDVLEKIHQGSGQARIIILGGTQDANQILQFFRYGASEYIHKPVRMEELIAAMERLYTKQSVDTKEESGCVIGVWGSRGGCGTTTIACNLAHILQKSFKTLLIDMNLQQGDLSVYLDIKPAYTMQELFESLNRMDSTLIGNFTTHVNERLSLLLLPIHGIPQNGRELEVERVIEIVRREYELVILDLGRDPSPANRLFSILDKLYLVTTQNLPSLYLAAQKIQWLQEVGHDQATIELVVNGYDRRSDITLRHIAKTLNIPTVHCIRHDEATVNKAMNTGKSLEETYRRSYSTQDLAGLAELLKANIAKGEVKEASTGLRLRPLFDRLPAKFESRLAEEQL